MKWDFEMVVLIVKWSLFWGGLKGEVYCVYIYIYDKYFTC